MGWEVQFFSDATVLYPNADYGKQGGRPPGEYDILELSQLPLEHLGLMTAKRNLIGGIA